MTIAPQLEELLLPALKENESTPSPQTADIDTKPERESPLDAPSAVTRELLGQSPLADPGESLLDAPPSAVTDERYEILGELGKGGMGVVYRALDRRTGRQVALKTMKKRDGLFLELFKGEFRYLQGVAHPNLVQLYDLKSDGEEWLLTMELVEGVSFLDYILSSAEPSPAVATIDYVPTTPAINAASGLTSLQISRLRETLGQLAEGIAALHAHRRIHRDLKPDNVCVTPEGRVVVLDFGLATDLGRTGEHRQDDQRLMGTIPYMAPEQGRDPPVSSPASDWYSVGVMLYKTLTGQLPFTGTALQVMQDKLLRDPPAPRELCPDAPNDLNDLCMALLRRQPRDRPSAAEILTRLGRKPFASPAGVTADEEAPLLGRERHLRVLDEAYTTSRQNRAVVVAVHGPSGIGKSSLVRHFLDRLREDGAVVLAGRCYEHESVPYKALDPLVDELGRYLRGRPRDEVETLLPADIAPLLRVFPVLGRVPAVAEAAAGSRLSSDPQEVRRQAFAGLRELLVRVGKDQPLVLHIDDLQWGDIDSAHLLVDLLQPPDPPRLLLVTSYRSEDADSPCLRALGKALGLGAAIDRRELVVAPLTDTETRELVLRLLGSGAEDRAAEIARESGGNPFFITELVQEIRSSRGQDAASAARGKITLEGLILGRVRHLPEGARRLLEVVAVSGRPLAELEAYRAAEVGAEGRVLMARLESARFLRGIGSAEEGYLETYHDRVRETVVTGLPPEMLREHHRRLADVLEQSGRGDPEHVAVHFEGAGELQKAGTYYGQAADGAATALAFDQAAALFQKSLDLRKVEGAEARDLRKNLGNALANAGRGAEAGPVYLAAAEGTEGRDKFELLRHAADQFLLGGCTQEGLQVLETLLHSVGLRFAGGKYRALFGMILERLRVRLRGLKFRERALESIPPEEIMRIDVCETAAHRLHMLNTVQSLVFSAKLVRLTLGAGETARLAEGLAMEAFFTASEGGTGPVRAEETRKEAMRLAERANNPLLLAKITLWGGYIAWVAGDWKKGLSRLESAVEIGTQGHVLAAVGLTKLRHGMLDCLMMLGRWREISCCLPAWLADARRRGDHFATSTMLVHSYVPCLAADRPDEAEAVTHQGWEAWPQVGNVMGTYWSLYGRVEAALYRSDGRRACELVRRERASLNRSTLFEFVSVLSLFMIHLQARAALAAAAAEPASGWYFSPHARLLRSAARDARRIERGRMPWSDPLAKLIRAGIANLRGKRDDAVSLLDAAEKELLPADMELYAAAARRQHGRLLGGVEGQALIASADTWMTGQDIRNPARITAMLVPGFAD